MLLIDGFTNGKVDKNPSVRILPTKLLTNKICPFIRTTSVIKKMNIINRKAYPSVIYVIIPT